MIKYALLLSLVALFLTGCISTGHQRPPAQQYRLAVLSSTGSAGKSGRHFPVVLRVEQPSAPKWLQKPRIYYRLTYKGKSRIAAYNRSHWVEPPPAMLAQALHEALAQSGVFNAVVGGSRGKAGLVLHFHLAHFEQPFKSRHHSAGLLQTRVTLTNPDTGRVLAQRRFHYRVTAPTANAQGGVEALSTASGKWIGAVTAWVQSTLAQCAPDCLPNSGT